MKEVFPQSSETKNLAVCVPNGNLPEIALSPLNVAPANVEEKAVSSHLVVIFSVHSSVTSIAIST